MLSLIIHNTAYKFMFDNIKYLKVIKASLKIL
jgi:hypothetical protein